MKLKQLALLIMTTGTIALTACNNQVGSSGASKNVQATEQMNKLQDTVEDISITPYTLGSGVLSKLGAVVTEASAFTIPEDQPIRISNLKHVNTFEFSDNSSSLMSELGISADLAVGAKNGNGSLLGNFLSNKRQTTHSIDYYSSSIHTATTELIGNMKNYYDLPNETSDDFGYGAYGDSYINTVTMGLAAVMKLSITSTSDSALTKLKVALNGSYESASMSVALDSLSDSDRKSISVDISMFQLGGTPSRLIEKVANGTPVKEEKGVKIFECNPLNMDACQTLMNRFVDYISIDESGSFISQTKTFLEEKTNSNYKPTYSDVIPLYPLPSATQQFRSNNGTYTVTTENNGKSTTTKIPTLEQSIKRSRAMVDAQEVYESALVNITRLVSANEKTFGIRGDINNASRNLALKISTLEATVKQYCQSADTMTSETSDNTCVTLLKQKTKALKNDLSGQPEELTTFKGFLVNGYSSFLYASDTENSDPHVVTLMAVFNDLKAYGRTKLYPGSIYVIDKEKNTFTVNENLADYNNNWWLPKDVAATISISDTQKDRNGNPDISSFSLSGDWVKGISESGSEVTEHQTISSTLSSKIQFD